MNRLSPFLILAGLAAELASIIMVGNFLGVVPTLLLILAGGVLGINLIKSAGTSIAVALRSPVQAASVQRGAAGKAIARVISGVLFVIPGFFSDFLGILILFPPVRAWLASKIRAGSIPAGGAPPRRYETVIEVEAIEVEGEIEPPEPPVRRNSGNIQER